MGSIKEFKLNGNSCEADFKLDGFWTIYYNDPVVFGVTQFPISTHRDLKKAIIQAERSLKVLKLRREVKK